MSEPYKLYQGDNLSVMRGLPSESIDLIYIDPPYFSQRNYGDFDDRWKSMQHYLDFMIERLKEMHRLLKPTGSIYVHLDWHAVHYVKVEMDKIFGYHNFKNSLSWCYRSAGFSKDRFSPKHDDILFYSKSGNHNFNMEAVREKEIGAETLRRFGKDIDKFGGFYYGRHNGKLYKKNPYSPPRDWFIVNALPQASKERTGYATQKPDELMERIILASSNEGDLVADFFCGSGSFIKKAFELGRRCIGCDMSPKALALAHCPTKRAVDGANAPQFQRVLPAEVRESGKVLPDPPRN